MSEIKLISHGQQIPQYPHRYIITFLQITGNQIPTKSSLSTTHQYVIYLGLKCFTRIPIHRIYQSHVYLKSATTFAGPRRIISATDISIRLAAEPESGRWPKATRATSTNFIASLPIQVSPPNKTRCSISTSDQWTRNDNQDVAFFIPTIQKIHQFCM